MSETALEHFLEALFWEGELLLRREPEEVSLATLSQEEELLRDELLRLLQGRTPPQQANPSSDAESSSSSSSSSSSPSSPLTTTTEEEVCRVREDECVVCLNEMANTVILTECWHPFHCMCLLAPSFLPTPQFFSMGTHCSL
ncbi:hypothetical protein QBC41DRAFT_125271 [Cercophora samala]|uniref:RING-type domain-containing protein n=1 Tax=Cercophora samala TaxID=330535 RepID=A0AA40DE85_9PEZI|nr:hypothetical protein QBC41DRAFT_125271 [Cercophora samala]